MAKIWTGLLTITALTMFSCEDPSDVGLGLDPNGLKSGVYYEELSLPSTNVFIDSLKTNGDARILVGSITDVTYGRTSAVSYSQLSTVSTIIGLSNTADTIFNQSDTVIIVTDQSYVVDSAVLVLRYNDISATDTSSLQTFRVQQLDDQLFSGVYYLANNVIPLVALDPDNETIRSIRTDSLILETPTYDTLQLPLSDSWANTLFDISLESDRNTILSQEFKGIAISGGENNTALISFNPTGETMLKVHYHIEASKHLSETEDSVYISSDSLAVDFSLTATNARYNGIITDRTGSLIGAAIQDNLADFDTGDGNIYFHSLSGIYPKIDMEPLLDFLAKPENEFVQINRFEFEVPTDASQLAYVDNVADMRFLLISEGGQVNHKGLVSGDLYSTAVLTDGGYLGGSQSIMSAPIDSANSYYSGVSTFFAQQVENGTIDLDQLIMMPSDITAPKQSVIPKEGIKLKVYYSIPN
ncbi:MAG: DUF4270 domain-containing protein [Reichenbachiella sp.]